MTMNDFIQLFLPAIAFLFGYWMRGREIRKQKADILHHINLLQKDVATWRGISTPPVS